MGAQEPIGIEQPYDVSRDSRDAVDSRRDAEFRSSAELFLEGLELPSELTFLSCEVAKEVLGFGGPRTERLLVTHTVQRLYEVFLGGDGFPMKSASKFLVFLTKVEEVLIKLDSIDGYPPLLSAEFLYLQRAFLSKPIMVMIERKNKTFRDFYRAARHSK